MSAVLQELDHMEDACEGIVQLAQVRCQDEYWRSSFECERYYVQGLDYEDYAPAYCVGYAGQAQYGGAFEDAERSLCANWERIKGDSRLALGDAIPAMRAAWDRMARGDRPALSLLAVGALRHSVEAASFTQDMAVAR